ncbi:MAG: arylsulfatase A-like enzyme [Crocinitomicaceae bacterium]|jgi:arylsulfatase A-like enzyme
MKQFLMMKPSLGPNLLHSASNLTRLSSVAFLKRVGAGSHSLYFHPIMSFFKFLFLTSFTCATLYGQDASSDSDIQPEKTEYLTQQSPNVILIVTDDMGYGDFSFHGNEWIKTPALDQLASNSARWKDFYVNPVCSPTRASVFTGRYHIRTKCVDTYLGRSMMAADEVTIAEALSGAGYKTGLFGKWHLGDNYPMRPSDQGFDTSLVHRGGGLGQPSDPIESEGRYTNPILFHNDQEVQTKGYCTDVFFNAAKNFIKRSKDNQQSFFAAITVNVPHGPFYDVPEDLLKKYQDKDFSAWGGDTQNLPKIAAMLDNLDANIGKLTGFLDQEKLIKNTVIIFINDNGANTLRYNKGLRGKKGQVYEGGVRSPLWIHWPEKIKNGRDINENIAAHIDLMPTILDICELGVPDAFEFDGRSLAPQILKPGTTLPERPIIIQWHRGATPVSRHHFMIRKGDWKLLNPSNSNSPRRDSENYELYNLSNDPSETTNLAGSEKSRVESLLKEYDLWFKDVNETRIRDLGTPYILVDRTKENPVVLTWQDRISKAWSYKEDGFWKLRFEHDGRCDIRLEFPNTFDRNLSGWTAHLSIGKQKYTQKIASNDKHYVFPAMSFTKGKHLLKASFISPDGIEFVSSYQVRLQHR